MDLPRWRALSVIYQRVPRGQEANEEIKDLVLLVFLEVASDC
jgi:hypothetical protein